MSVHGFTDAQMATFREMDWHRLQVLYGLWQAMGPGQRRQVDPLEGDQEAQEERYDLHEDDDGDEDDYEEELWNPTGDE
jgi:hypothetical protein